MLDQDGSANINGASRGKVNKVARFQVRLA